MVLDKLGSSLQNTLKKLAGVGRIDEKVVGDAVKEIQRALLQSDVNVKLVMELSKTIKERSLKEDVPPGMSPREHVINIVYQELINIMGAGTDVKLTGQKIMMVGLQGSGKTTTTSKLARFFQRKGLKPAVICADTYRPGAYEQLSTLCDRLNVSFYGEKDNKDAVAIVKHGMEAVGKSDVLIIDTAGRHAMEDDLILEMEEIHNVSMPEHKLLVIDAALGQQASEQAKVFNQSIGITGVVISKLDGTAKGGGALSAVSETGTSIAYIGTGERPDDFEKFEPDRFISRLLGMGDIKSLVERAEEAMAEEEFDVENMMKGKFTLKDMYKQMEAMNKMGPLKQIMQMMPGLPMLPKGTDISEEQFQTTESTLKKFKVVMDSMTDKELEEPKIVGSSRIKRIAMGSGNSQEDVRLLLKQHKMMQQAFKGLRGGKFNLQKMMKKMGG
jgi:signal recognition particle subunit SRP54